MTSFRFLSSVVWMNWMINECSKRQTNDFQQLMEQEKTQVFQKCQEQMVSKTRSSFSSSSSSSFLHVLDFISETNLTPQASETLCSHHECVQALIKAMETFPDCCLSTTTTATTNQTTFRNFPRLADDLLHQCDLRDARLLAYELEKEVAKLPDFKVQIKAMGANASTSMVQGMDVIIDVKKREIMKKGDGSPHRKEDGNDPLNNRQNASATTMGSTAISAFVWGIVGFIGCLVF
jgi:hypothetical protein